jgi:hypothetical protein
MLQCCHITTTATDTQVFFYLVCEAIGNVATPGLLCQTRAIVKMIVEKQMECRLAGETEVLGENLPEHHFCPSQNPTWPDPDLNPGRHGAKPATNCLSYGAATHTQLQEYWAHFVISLRVLYYVHTRKMVAAYVLYIFINTLLGYRYLWAFCLENVGASMFHNPMGLHGLLRGYSFTILG